jgi:hypothetical protein
MYYTFTFNVEMEASEMDKLWEFDELAEVHGGWTRMALLGEDFEQSLERQMGMCASVLSATYTGDKRNRRR